jgi:cell division protein FtsZ
MLFEYAEESERLADIKVAGVGGAGGNAVGRMIEAGLSGVEFLSINTDLQALKDSQAHQCMQIGAQLTKGLGSGGDPARGKAAAEEDCDRLTSALSGADMVFVTAGMGGGTGTGAAPIIADIARNQGALTVGIVTKPFGFEGKVRMTQAMSGIEELKEAVDTLILIPNQRLLEVVPPNTSMQEAFRIADNVLYEATRGIFEIISRHDHVNLDFADVRSVMKGMGEAMMGTGRAEGENRAIEAARAAISSPLLENVDINGSKAVLVNVLGREVGLEDTAQAMQYIQDAAGPEAHVIFGYGNDESMGDTLQVTVIATGFNPESIKHRPAATVPAKTHVVRAVEDMPAETRVEVPAEPEPHVEPNVAGEFNEEAATLAATRSRAGEPDGRVSIMMNDLSEAIAETPPGPDPETPAASLDRQGMAAEKVSEPSESFLSRAAAARGAEVIRPAETGEPGLADNSAATAKEETSQPFLKPLGTQIIEPSDTPEWSGRQTSLNRSMASGIGPENPGDDLMAPAYTRKYMD